MLLLGSAAKPGHGQRAILWQPDAIAIHDAESELGIDLSLLGRTSKPMSSATAILRNAVATSVHGSDQLLSVRVPLMRERLQDLARSRVITDGISHEPVQQLTWVRLAVCRGRCRAFFRPQRGGRCCGHEQD